MAGLIKRGKIFYVVWCRFRRLRQKVRRRKKGEGEIDLYAASS